MPMWLGMGLIVGVELASAVSARGNISHSSHFAGMFSQFGL